MILVFGKFCSSLYQKCAQLNLKKLNLKKSKVAESLISSYQINCMNGNMSSVSSWFTCPVEGVLHFDFELCFDFWFWIFVLDSISLTCSVKRVVILELFVFWFRIRILIWLTCSVEGVVILELERFFILTTLTSEALGAPGHHSSILNWAAREISKINDEKYKSARLAVLLIAPRYGRLFSLSACHRLCVFEPLTPPS